MALGGQREQSDDDIGKHPFRIGGINGAWLACSYSNDKSVGDFRGIPFTDSLMFVLAAVRISRERHAPACIPSRQALERAAQQLGPWVLRGYARAWLSLCCAAELARRPRIVAKFEVKQGVCPNRSLFGFESGCLRKSMTS